MKTFFCVSPRSNCSKTLDNILESVNINEIRNIAKKVVFTAPHK